MKDRTFHFLGEDKIDHDGEIFDYVQELHSYLWRFVRAGSPGASGTLDSFVDSAVEQAERDSGKVRELKEEIFAFRQELRDAEMDTAEVERDSAETAEFNLELMSERDHLQAELKALRQGIADLLV